MRNFDYIKDLGIDNLYRFCASAEENQVSNPDICAISARRALEYLVREIYKMKGLEIGEPFSGFIGDGKVMMAVHYVRKVGNNAAHLVDVSKREAFFCVAQHLQHCGCSVVKTACS